MRRTLLVSPLTTALALALLTGTAVVAQDAPQLSPGVKRLAHLRTMHLGPEEVLVGMKVIVDDDARVRDSAQIVDLLEARLRAELPILRRIYVEIGTEEDPRVRMSGAGA